MFWTTSGEKRETPVSREDLEEQVGLLSINKAMEKPQTEEEIVYRAGYLEAIKEVSDLIKELPVIESADGKKLVKRYYPRICVRDNCSKDSVRQVGSNTHDVLEVKHERNASYISYLNLQCMCGTDYADEGFTFVGEHHPPEWEDDTEYIPFDEVWVEVNDENK